MKKRDVPLMSLSRAKILTLIHKSEDPLTISEISDLTGMKRSAVYHHLEELKQRKLVLESKEEKQQGKPVFITTNKANPMSLQTIQFAEKFLEFSGVKQKIPNPKPKPQKEYILDVPFEKLQNELDNARKSNFDFSKVKHMLVYLDTKAGSPALAKASQEILNDKVSSILPKDTLVSIGYRITPKGKDSAKVIFSTLKPLRFEVMKSYRSYNMDKMLVPMVN